MDLQPHTLRVAIVIPASSSGGVGTVCGYAADSLAERGEWQVTLVSLHDSPISVPPGPATAARVSLGLSPSECAVGFLEWLSLNPHHVVLSSDVFHLTPAFPYFPSSTRHIVQVHDSMRRYRQDAVSNQRWVDGVCCVARHIEDRLSGELAVAGFRGLLRTVYNGAYFPPAPARSLREGPLRLLFTGRVETLKGAPDLLPILKHLRALHVPVVLTIVGGVNERLRLQFERAGLGDAVTWAGHQPHARCYEFAAESDIFLMPSRKEAFGMATIEAMSMGCVPIAYDFPSGSTEVITPDQSGLLVPLGNYSRWASAIRALHIDRRRLAALSAGAMHRARTCFSAEKMGGSLASFVRDVADIQAEPERLVGRPSVEMAPSRRGLFQRLPAAFRAQAKDLIFRSPKLAHWILHR